MEEALRVQQGDWPSQFEMLVRSHVPNPPSPGGLDPTLNLRDAGLNSLATIRLLIELEAVFGFSFSDDLLSAETFSTPGNLWNAVSSCLVSNDTNCETDSDK
jgi:acyl carrier protein